MTGLVNSVIAASILPTTEAIIQPVLFPDDAPRQIADLERRLAESEAAYLALCNHVEILEGDLRKLLAENHCLQQRVQDFARVAIVGCRGLVRR